MRKALLATAALSMVSIVPALAADMPVRAPTKAVVAAAPVATWTGFYVGAVGGYGRENADLFPLTGALAGGTLGYNWQTGQFVVGVETDAAWSNIGAVVGVPGVAALEERMNVIGTVRGRIGVALDQILLYGTGGYAWARDTVSATLLGVTVSDTQFRSGWTAGAGVEAIIAPKWSVKAEYLYRSFNSQTFFGIPAGTANINSVQVGVNYHF